MLQIVKSALPCTTSTDHVSRCHEPFLQSVLRAIVSVYDTVPCAVEQTTEQGCTETHVCLENKLLITDGDEFISATTVTFELRKTLLHPQIEAKACLYAKDIAKGK